MKKKFEISYFIAKHEFQYSTYEDIVQLETLHGVDIGKGYVNRFQCKEFIQCHGEYLSEKLKTDLQHANFFSVLIDGATDTSATEKEVIYVLYFDPNNASDEVEVKLSFVHLKDMKKADAQGLKSAIESCFEALDIGRTELYSKLVGLGADGASVNSGEKTGLNGLLKRECPWLLFQWCVAHRLELAVRDALQNTYFKQVDHMLMRLYFIYHKSPKKLS